MKFNCVCVSARFVFFDQKLTLFCGSVADANAAAAGSID